MFLPELNFPNSVVSAASIHFLVMESISHSWSFTSQKHKNSTLSSYEFWENEPARWCHGRSTGKIVLTTSRTPGNLGEQHSFFRNFEIIVLKQIRIIQISNYQNFHQGVSEYISANHLLQCARCLWKNRTKKIFKITNLKIDEIYNFENTISRIHAHLFCFILPQAASTMW